MPMLNWNEHEFIECLEVLPVELYDGAGHRFVTRRNGLELTLVVWKYDSVIEISIRQTEYDVPLIQFVLVVRGGVHFKRNTPPEAEYLLFRDVFVAPREGSYTNYEHLNWYNPSDLPGIQEVLISIRPSIRVEFVD